VRAAVRQARSAGADAVLTAAGRAWISEDVTPVVRDELNSYDRNMFRTEIGLRTSESILDGLCGVHTTGPALPTGTQYGHGSPRRWSQWDAGSRPPPCPVDALFVDPDCRPPVAADEDEVVATDWTAQYRRDSGRGRARRTHPNESWRMRDIFAAAQETLRRPS
jgi:hypothetical protein